VPRVAGASFPCLRSARLRVPLPTSVAKGERLQNVRLTDRSVAKIVKAHAWRDGLWLARWLRMHEIEAL
jgi:hypothetical protein